MKILFSNPDTLLKKTYNTLSFYRTGKPTHLVDNNFKVELYDREKASQLHSTIEKVLLVALPVITIAGLTIGATLLTPYLALTALPIFGVPLLVYYISNRIFLNKIEDVEKNHPSSPHPNLDSKEPEDQEVKSLEFSPPLLGRVSPLVDAPQPEPHNAQLVDASDLEEKKDEGPEQARCCPMEEMKRPDAPRKGIERERVEKITDYALQALENFVLDPKPLRDHVFRIFYHPKDAQDSSNALYQALNKIALRAFHAALHPEIYCFGQPRNRPFKVKNIFELSVKVYTTSAYLEINPLFRGDGKLELFKPELHALVGLCVQVYLLRAQNCPFFNGQKSVNSPCRFNGKVRRAMEIIDMAKHNALLNDGQPHFVNSFVSTTYDSKPNTGKFGDDTYEVTRAPGSLFGIVLPKEHTHHPNEDEVLFPIGSQLTFKVFRNQEKGNIQMQSLPQVSSLSLADGMEKKGAIEEPLPLSFKMDQFTKISGQLGTNPGGKYLHVQTGKIYYIKMQKKSGDPQEAEKKRGEVLAAKLYEAAGVHTPHNEIFEDDGQVFIASEWVEGLQTFQEKRGKDHTFFNQLKEISGLNQGLVIDCWLNNWDVAGLTFDNLSVVQNGETLAAVRVDTGGAFDFRAQASKSKTQSYGEDAFSDHVEMLLSVFTRNPQAKKVFMTATVGDFYAGIDALEKLSDEKIHDLIFKLGPENSDQKLDLFMKMLKRKYYLIEYKHFLEIQVDDHNQLLMDRFKNPISGVTAFKKVFSAHHAIGTHKDPTLTKKSPIEKIAWDIAKKFYLESEDKSFEGLYQNFEVKEPEYPIKRIKHGAMHVARVAIACENLLKLYRKHNVKGAAEVTEEELKILQIAALFHDAGRKVDTGADCEAWERAGFNECLNYLKALGYNEEKVKHIAEAIIRKDEPFHTKNIFDHILHDADSLDVLRSHNWKFNPKYLDLTTFKVPAEEIDALVEAHRKGVVKMDDAPQSYQGMPGSFDLAKKRLWEFDPNFFTKIKAALSY